MRHSFPDPEQRCAPDHPDHADRNGASGTGSGARTSPAPQTAADPVPGYTHVTGTAAAQVIPEGSVGNGADADSHDPFDPTLPFDALHAAPRSAEPPSTPCPDGSWGVDCPVLRASLAEVLTRWTVAASVRLCAGSDPVAGDAGPTRLRHRADPGGGPEPRHPHPGASSLPGRDPGCPASDAIARLRSLIARHLPRATCPDAGHDGTGTDECGRVRETGAGSAGTTEQGSRNLSGPGPGRETGCRIGLDRVEQAERRWLGFVRTWWPLRADASQAETFGRDRDSRGVAGGGDRC